MEDFFRNPQQTSFQLSPDGEKLAFLAPWKNRLNIHIREIETDNSTRITAATERDIAGYLWANNTRIVFLQDTAGDENFRLFAVDIDGKNHTRLTPFNDVRVQIVDDLEDIEDEILIGMNKRDKQIFDVYRLHVNSGEMSMIAENPGNISGWHTDNEGKLRVATTTDGVNTGILYRNTEEEKFHEVLTTTFRETLNPLFFTFNDDAIYAASNLGRDKQAIVKYDLENNIELDIIYEHPEVDVSHLLRSKEREVITGVTYFTDYRNYEFFDEERAQLQTSLEEQLPGYEVSLSSSSKNERRLLVRTHSDRSRGAYYFHDRDTNELTKLVDVSPWLKEDEMAPMYPVEYSARDGLTIPGYLTLPKGQSPENLPVVINPHGGPWVRDHWGFNPEVQFLANRGYAVLQMNYRSSTGYGRDYWERGFKEWGKAMQDDITDGVHALIEENIADPDAVAIYGGSYGGYATLAGLTFTPDLYACGVDYVGVSNLFTFMESIPPYWEQYRQMLYEMVGHPEQDKDLLASASPVMHVDKIKAPLLIAQGANDPRVNKDESDQMVEALRDRGIEVPYMVKENEGHGFHNEENRFDFYRAMEQFLARHLNGRAGNGDISALLT
ncbi:MAG: S9 family peptidase [Candidatus Marinimicrobia bacterium]|nr:S9 family peptidase [Candidatus Neomarinimicrobiota bacterium]MCF7828193.1 S9 family peptidase [Candidatus Neomarinimicrobiota bacterium]MCF7879632.1 S9 family peptidase [Candidatus Neomarinimicrobiota bacterium]